MHLLCCASLSVHACVTLFYRFLQVLSAQKFALLICYRVKLSGSPNWELVFLLESQLGLVSTRVPSTVVEPAVARARC